MHVVICMYYAGSVRSQGLSNAWSRLPVHVGALCAEREASSRRADPSGQAWEASLLLLAQKGEPSLSDFAEVFLAWLESWSAAHWGCCAVLQSAGVDMSEPFSDENIDPFFPYLLLIEQGVCASFPSHKAEVQHPTRPFLCLAYLFLSWLGLPFGICGCWKKNQWYRSPVFYLKLIFVFVRSADFCFCDAFRIFLSLCSCTKSMVKWAGYGFNSPIDFVLLQDIFTLNANSCSYNIIWIMKSF